MLKNKVIIPLTALMILSICSITSCNNNTSSSSSSSSNTSSVVELNYLALTRRIEYVKNNYLTEEKKSLYTAESITILENAVKEGESLVNNAKTQQEIDDAVIKINNAIDNLISNINPDKTLDEIGEFLDNCNGNYTLKVNDYYKNNNETPISYTIKSTDKAIYDVEKMKVSLNLMAMSITLIMSTTIFLSEEYILVKVKARLYILPKIV